MAVHGPDPLQPPCLQTHLILPLLHRQRPQLHLLPPSPQSRGLPPPPPEGRGAALPLGPPHPPGRGPAGRPPHLGPHLPGPALPSLLRALRLLPPHR